MSGYQHSRLKHRNTIIAYILGKKRVGGMHTVVSTRRHQWHIYDLAKGTTRHCHPCSNHKVKAKGAWPNGPLDRPLVDTLKTTLPRDKWDCRVARG